MDPTKPNEHSVNPFRQKLSEEERRHLVADVGRGLRVSHAAEKYGITTAAAWNLVNKEALRLLFVDAGFPGFTPDRYLREKTLIESTMAALPQKTTSLEPAPSGCSVEESGSLGTAARAAAAALQRLAAATEGQRP